MTRGPAPKPVEQRILEGNPANRPLPRRVDLGEFKDLEPPDNLPDEGKEFWKRAVPVLQEVGLLSTVDFAALEGMATLYARAKDAAKVVAEEGFLSWGAAGQQKEHPAVKVERESWQGFRMIAQEYALTPSARTRLGLAELQGRKMQAEMDDFLGPPVLEPVNGDGG